RRWRSRVRTSAACQRDPTPGCGPRRQPGYLRPGPRMPADHHESRVRGRQGVGGRWGEGVSEEFPALTGFRAGSVVGGYRLGARVGAGGMAVVFRARDGRLDRLVALKLLGAALAADGAFRRRFIAESRAAAAVDDPHIIPVYEAGEANGVLFIAMR